MESNIVAPSTTKQEEKGVKTRLMLVRYGLFNIFVLYLMGGVVPLMVKNHTSFSKFSTDNSSSMTFPVSSSFQTNL